MGGFLKGSCENASADAHGSVRYFTTSIRGAGIFLPSNKAYKRLSPSFSSGSIPHTPDAASQDSYGLGGRADTRINTPTTSSTTSKFSQSVGPSRARSPDFKPKQRPSLPRPESPLRKAQNTVSTPTTRPSIGAPKLSKSMIGGPRYAPSPTPAKFGSSVRGVKDGDPGKRILPTKPVPKTPTSGRPQSRSDSHLGPEAMFDEEADDTPTGGAKAFQSTRGVQQRPQPTPHKDEEIRQLRAELEARDRQLDKQTADLEEMQSSVAELQLVTPKHNSAGTMRSRGSGIDELDASQLRALVREKNDKIAMLTSDFDTHRAQFRNTIDSLERTSDETNRIYEHKVDELTQQIRDLQDRGDDVESVAQQLKQLEELVQELEEGLEDARRGEAEARGEVEFLRGEVERTRSELRREREKAAAALKGAGATMEGAFSPGGSSREVEQRDDEIRGLKAIIHSLSHDAGSPKHGSRRVSKQRQSGLSQTGTIDTQLAEERQVREKLEREIKELEGLVDRKTYREEELEHEIERLRKVTGHVSASSNGFSVKTALPNGSHRPNLSKDSSNDWHEQSTHANKLRNLHLDNRPESDSHSTTMTDSSTLYCEMCETFGHEIFTCPNINGDSNSPSQDQRPDSSSRRTGREIVAEGLKLSAHTNDYPPPLSPARSPGPDARSPAATPRANVMPNPIDQGPAAGKKSGVVDMERWCALCERDGHESVDCPFEDIY